MASIRVETVVVLWLPLAVRCVRCSTSAECRVQGDDVGGTRDRDERRERRSVSGGHGGLAAQVGFPEVMMSTCGLCFSHHNH